MPASKHRVWIVWGSPSSVAETEGETLEEYEFDTAAELAAFLKGVDEADGWLEHHQCNTKEEADDYVAECKKDEPAEQSND